MLGDTFNLGFGDMVKDEIGKRYKIPKNEASGTILLGTPHQVMGWYFLDRLYDSA